MADVAVRRIDFGYFVRPQFDPRLVYFAHDRSVWVP